MRALSLLVVMGLAAPAAADGTSLQGMMVTAETAERSARESNDPAAYETCGQAYVEVANAARTEAPAIVPEAMYNAGVCFEHGGAIGAAIRLYAMLEAELPSNPLAHRALARRGQLYWRIASFAEAAKAFETYASKYAGEKDASDALENAFRLRMAIGDEDAARADAEQWIRKFGAKRPREAAGAALALARMTREHATRDEATRAYRQWIKVHGGRAERHQTVAVYVALGELLWDASCEVKGTPEGGLCLAPAKRTAAPRCGNPPALAVARDAKLAAEATKVFDLAVRKARSTASDDLAQIAAEPARLYLVDARIEQAIAREMTAPLVDRAGVMTAASKKEQSTWIAEWQKGLADASRALEPLLRSKNLRVAVAAQGRMAWLYRHAADTLASAPLPKWKKPLLEEMRGSYCDALADLAASIAERANDAADACLRLSEQTQVVDETTQCVEVFDRHGGTAIGGGERLPAAAWPRVRDVEPEIRYRPRGTFTPSPP